MIYVNVEYVCIFLINFKKIYIFKHIIIRIFFFFKRNPSYLEILYELLNNFSLPFPNIFALCKNYDKIEYIPK
jgi:hypothetical protein